MGLGYLGLNSREKANGFLEKVREMDVNHQGAQIHLPSRSPQHLLNRGLANPIELRVTHGKRIVTNFIPY
jgi:hypothetical protein